MTMLSTLFLLLLLVLAWTRKTPQQLLYSILREAEKGLRRMNVRIPGLERLLEENNPKRVFHSPFLRLHGDVRHLPMLLNLPTSEGSGEAAHPDVLHVPGGWGKDGWTWLMTATPYPMGTDYFENPEFYVSRDGLRWRVPEGLRNPLARVPVEPSRREIRREFHSDPSLLLHEGLLHLYYRWTAVLNTGETENRILLTTSPDGVVWSPPEAVLSERLPTGSDRKFLSPSALVLDGTRVLWTVDCEAGDRFIVRRTSPDGLHWSGPVKTEIAAPFPLKAPWHLDVSGGGGCLRLLLTTARDRGVDAELLWGWSGDGGLSWDIKGKPFEPGYFFEEKRIYRSSIVPMEDGTERLYYSAMAGDGTWHVAALDLGAPPPYKTGIEEK